MCTEPWNNLYKSLCIESFWGKRKGSFFIYTEKRKEMAQKYQKHSIPETEPCKKQKIYEQCFPRIEIRMI